MWKSKNRIDEDNSDERRFSSKWTVNEIMIYIEGQHLLCSPPFITQWLEKIRKKARIALPGQRWLTNIIFRLAYDRNVIKIRNGTWPQSHLNAIWRPRPWNRSIPEKTCTRTTCRHVCTAFYPVCYSLEAETINQICMYLNGYDCRRYEEPLEVICQSSITHDKRRTRHLHSVV